MTVDARGFDRDTGFGREPWTGSRSVGQNRRIAGWLLWVLQAVLAVLFLASGAAKLAMPVDILTAQMSLPLPGWFVRFLGMAELLGAFGLVLPGLLRVRPTLTPLAACGLAVIMTGATVITLATGGGAAALLPLVIGLLAALVVYGRRRLAPLAGR